MRGTLVVLSALQLLNRGAALHQHEVSSVQLNKTCAHDDHCNDFRMVCRNEACVCTRFYAWHYEVKECVLILEELKEWLASLSEERDYSAEINEEAHKTFYSIGVAGILAASLGFLGVMACVCVLCISRVLVDSEYEAGQSSEAQSLYPRKQITPEEMVKDGDGGLSHVALTTNPQLCNITL